MTGTPPQDRSFKIRLWSFLGLIISGLLVFQVWQVQAQRTVRDAYNGNGAERAIATLEAQQEHLAGDIAELRKRDMAHEERIGGLEKITASMLASVQYLTYTATGITGVVGALVTALLIRAAKLKG